MTLSGIINGIRNIVSTVGNVIGNVIGAVLGAVHSAETAALHFGEKIVEGILHGLAGLPGLVLKEFEKIPIVGGLIKAGGHALGGLIHGVGSALGLASGGIVVKPTIAARAQSPRRSSPCPSCARCSLADPATFIRPLAAGRAHSRPRAV